MQDVKKEPAYGAEVLRLWVATVEFWNDMALGKFALDQTAGALRKIRNSVRFMLANIGEDARPGSFEPVRREDMGLVRLNHFYWF